MNNTNDTWQTVYKKMTGHHATEAPEALYDALSRAERLCVNAGGALKSRQAIAAIILAHELSLSPEKP